MLDRADDYMLQRSQGMARVVLRARGGRAALSELHQSGSAKAFLPRGAADEAIFLNTSGGLTGGDRLCYALDLAAGLRFVATTQTAERAYASSGPLAEVSVSLRLGAGASLDWLPQETLLYDRSALRRETRVDLAQDAALLLCEMVVLGRHAMGESLRDLRFHDRRRVFRDGRPVWAESLTLDTAILQHRDGAALLADARCLAVVALIAPGAADAAPALHPLLAAEGVESALSAWNGKLILRLTARDNWPMKRQLARILTQLRGRPLPRVWQMNGDIA